MTEPRSMFQSFEITADSAESAARIAALRAMLQTLDLAAFLVPRSDAHAGETVAPSDERLAWLTGFTGSAGVAIVTADRAALFVDGRYTLQAADQTDASVLEVLQTPATKPADWLAEVLPGDAAAGFDPWLHAPADIERYETALGRALTAVEQNPVDTLWADRPPPPAGAITVHPETLAGESAEQK
ncbi:MAG: aminopeptidase P family N-terminal domain-containing protein, partial [Pseudomonadota bacterium]